MEATDICLISRHYLASFPLHAPLSRSSWDLFGFFFSLRPALPIILGLIRLLFLSTPRSLYLPRVYFASFPLYAPLSRSSWDLFGFFFSLRPALSIFPGFISLLFLFLPRFLDLSGAYFTSYSRLRPRTQKSLPPTMTPS